MRNLIIFVLGPGKEKFIPCFNTPVSTGRHLYFKSREATREDQVTYRAPARAKSSVMS